MSDSPQTLTRRDFSRLLAGTSLGLAAAGLVATSPAAAGRRWCKMDPEFLVNGIKLHVYLSGPEELHDIVTGPANVTLWIPARGAQAEFIWADEGLGGLGYNIRILTSNDLVIDPASGAIPVEVMSTVPASAPMEMAVEAVYDKASGKQVSQDLKKGITNQSVRVKAKLA